MYEIVSQDLFHYLPRLEQLPSTPLFTASWSYWFLLPDAHYRLGTPTVKMARHMTVNNQAYDVITGENEPNGILIWGRGRQKEGKK